MSSHYTQKHHDQWKTKIRICPSYNPLDESQGPSQCSFWVLLTKLKNYGENGTKLQPPWEDQHKPRGNRQIIPIWGLTFHVTTKLLQVTIRSFTRPPSRIEFVKNILVGHVQGLILIRESPFPLNPIIILHSVPNESTYFVNGP